MQLHRSASSLTSESQNGPLRFQLQLYFYEDANAFRSETVLLSEVLTADTGNTATVAEGATNGILTLLHTRRGPLSGSNSWRSKVWISDFSVSCMRDVVGDIASNAEDVQMLLHVLRQHHSIRATRNHSYLCTRTICQRKQ